VSITGLSVQFNDNNTNKMTTGKLSRMKIMPNTRRAISSAMHGTQEVWKQSVLSFFLSNRNARSRKRGFWTGSHGLDMVIITKERKEKKEEKEKEQERTD
jgi:trehalose-6-phosphate synthase